MVAAAILAGGRGRRMGGGEAGTGIAAAGRTTGVVKPFLLVEGRRIIDRQLAVLRPLFGAVVIVAADRATFDGAGGALGVDIVTDRRGPDLGPLAGLESALAWLPAAFDACVCVAGDMPFLAPALLRHLRDVRPANAPAVVPRVAGQLQPLCARYHRGLASLVTAELDAGTRAMHIFVARVAASRSDPPAVITLGDDDLRAHDPQLATFININSPGDLAAVDRERRRG